MSVIVPCFNHGATLRRALDSIVVSTQSLQVGPTKTLPPPTTASAPISHTQLVPMRGWVAVSSLIQLAAPRCLEGRVLLGGCSNERNWCGGTGALQEWCDRELRGGCPQVEVVVVDDDSSDTTATVARAFEVGGTPRVAEAVGGGGEAGHSERDSGMG